MAYFKLNSLFGDLMGRIKYETFIIFMSFFSIGSWFLWFIIMLSAFGHYGKFYLDFNSKNEMVLEFVMITIILLSSIIFLIVFVKNCLKEYKADIPIQIKVEA